MLASGALLVMAGECLREYASARSDKCDRRCDCCTRMSGFRPGYSARLAARTGSPAQVIYVSVHCRYRLTLILQFVRPAVLLVITPWYICLPYSGTILAQQVIALHTELQRPKPL